MKAFGLEIRKIGNVQSLYSEVDLVLKKAGVEQHSVGGAVQAQTVAHALQKMLKADNWFSVVSIKDCAAVASIYITSERMKIYEAIHCVKWNEIYLKIVNYNIPGDLLKKELKQHYHITPKPKAS